MNARSAQASDPRPDVALAAPTPAHRRKPVAPPKVATRIIFNAIARAALPVLPAILDRLGVRWRRNGREIAMLNPRRADQRFGSFSVNTTTGKWADFADGAAGGDVVSLVAYIGGTGQCDAARSLAAMLRIDL